jgi:FkbM family methyltransferase
MASAARLADYFREMRYCISAADDVRSCASLMWHTVRFHAMNAYKPNLVENVPFSINLQFLDEHTRRVFLRPHGGDIFVLYEVCMLQTYRIPDSQLDRDKVEVIVDCGANIGITSLYFASRYPRATIFSVEPHPDNFEMLKFNANAEKRIVPVNAAVVGLPRNTIKLSTNAPAWGNKITEDANGITVPAISLQQLRDKYGIGTIDLLKVDIEGAEEEVFANGEFLPDVNFGIIELHGGYGHTQFEKDIDRWHFAMHMPEAGSETRMITFSRKPG